MVVILPVVGFGYTLDHIVQQPSIFTIQKNSYSVPIFETAIKLATKAVIAGAVFKIFGALKIHDKSTHGRRFVVVRRQVQFYHFRAQHFGGFALLCQLHVDDVLAKVTWSHPQTRCGLLRVNVEFTCNRGAIREVSRSAQTSFVFGGWLGVGTVDHPNGLQHVFVHPGIVGLPGKVGQDDL